MSDEKHINCPKFGGTRMPHACAHFDRYRGCRRGCSSLRAFIKETPTFEEEVKERYDGRHIHLPCTSTLKNLPAGEFVCDKCLYKAKSGRGLSMHMKRSHKA